MIKSKWLLLGGESLLGKEIRDLVAERKLPVTLTLASTASDNRVLTADEDELTVMQPLTDESLDGADVVLLGASPEVNKSALAKARGLAQRPAYIDLHGDFEDLPESCLRAPILESDQLETAAETIHTLAHPTAVYLARLLALIHAQFPLQHSVATVFQPVSERGKEGVDELHKQTVGMLSFQKMPKAVFDAQVSFNLLPRYGEEAPVSLESFEQRVERHLASLLGARGVPLPSVKLVHAPVFHGCCQNVWVEFASRPAVVDVEKALEEAGVEVRRADVEPGSNVSVAGMSGITVSDIRDDRTNARGMWLWMAYDNIRALAENAVLTAGLAARGRRERKDR